MIFLLSLLGRTGGLELVWICMSSPFLVLPPAPGILHAAGAQKLSYIDDQIIADNEGKHTGLKGGLS
jgi:hypothetical protein